MKIFSEFAMALTAPDAPRPAHVLDATGHGCTTRHSIHAADAAPLDASVLAEAPPEQFGELRLQPHPSARWMTDAQPVLAIWNRHNGQPAASEPAGEILLCRPAMTVLQIAAPLGTSATLQALAAGLPLQDALPADADHAAFFAALFAVSALRALPPPL